MLSKGIVHHIVDNQLKFKKIYHDKLYDNNGKVKILKDNGICSTEFRAIDSFCAP